MSLKKRARLRDKAWLIVDEEELEEKELEEPTGP